jgi:PAS domain S-box-containing protein
MPNDTPTVELRDFEAGYETLEHLTDAFLILDETWRFTYVNKEAERLWRRSREDLLGRSIWVAFPDLVGSVFDQACRRALAEQTLVAFESYYEPLSRWLSVRAHPAKGGLSICFRDVASHQQAEEALRKSEERLRSLIETTSDWIWEVDERFVYTYVSPRVRDLLGYEPEEVLGKTPFDFMPPEEARRTREAVAAGEPLFAFENENRHKDGRSVILETSARPFFDTQGVFCGYRGIDRDITKRKQEEAARARLIAIIEATTDFVATADTSGRVLYYNRAARRMLGIGEDEDISSIRIPDTHPPWANEVVSNQGIPTANREGLWVGETALLSREGREIPISQLIIAHKAPDGRVEYLSTIGRDVTMRKHIEQLRQEYIQAMLHDLRSPLSAIGMQARLLDAGLGANWPAADAKRSLEIVSRGVRRMAEMIRELAESANMEGGPFRLERQPIALRPFVADLLEGSGLAAQSERIQLEIPADCPPVRADPGYLERIFSNLLGNALKYSPREARVWVKARLDGDIVTVSVSDEGTGIAEEDLPRIFERFYRSGEARRIEGLGLGLYITRKLIEAHGGRIWVDEETGQGATFHFTLPRSSAAASQ